MKRTFSLPVLAILLGLAGAASATLPDAPLVMSYQGVLLDTLGDPRTGPVDLTVRVYDATSAGVLVYKQEFSSVPLADGVFTIQIGPAGAATDTPVNPLTTDLGDAFRVDFPSASGNRFVELTVGSEGSLGRIQVLSAPYAIHADSADSATTAATAQSATTVNGLDASFVTELFEHGNADGTGEDNDGPTEGLGDTDLDGIANFIDPDNDNDSLNDGTEINQGSDPNLVTPILNSFSPSSAPSHKPTLVTGNGQNFDPGLTVLFGSENPAPQNVTSTSFDVTVGPQAVGTANVTATNPSLENDSQNFAFFLQVPNVTSFTPNRLLAPFTSFARVNGTDFEPGLTVQFGSENPIPQNVTETGFDVTVGPQAEGNASVTVTITNGEDDTELFPFGTDVPHSAFFGAQQHATMSVTGTHQTVVASGTTYQVDSDAFLNAVPDLSFPFVGPIGGSTPASMPALIFDPAGELAGIRCRNTGAGCDVEVYRDADGDRDLELSEAVVIESEGGVEPRLFSPGLAFDPSGHLVAGYVLLSNFGNTARAVVLHDLDGDGQFTGTNERVVVEQNPAILGLGSNRAGGVAVDSSGRVAYAYAVSLGGQQRIRVAHDRSGDDDFDDSPGGNPELFTAATTTFAFDCAGAAFDPSDRLAVVYSRTTVAATALRDLDGNGDFGGVGETIVLESGGGGGGCAITGGAGPLAVAFRESSPDSIVLAIDRDDDGTFGGAGEILTLGTGGGSASRVAAAQNAAGLTFVADGNGGGGAIYLDPGPP